MMQFGLRAFILILFSLHYFTVQHTFAQPPSVKQLKPSPPSLDLI